MSFHRNPRATQWALLFGNFVIGMGVLMPAGLLNDLNLAFAQDAATTGTLMAYGAAVLCIEAPLLAFFTNTMDRRRLLTAALIVYALGHFASALAPNFATLMIARLIMIGGAAAFTPQAASAMSLLVPVERRSTAVAFIFLGWPLASAFGIPLASLLGAYVGWQSSYFLMGLACSAAAFCVYSTMPANLHPPRMSLTAWRNVVTSGKIVWILAVTLVFIAAQFAVYPYIANDLKTRLDASPALISILFAVYGISGAVGSIVSTRVIGRFGAARTVSTHLFIVLVGLALWSLSGSSLALATAGLLAWGYGGGPAISGQQARLIAAEPDAASASVALNTSLLYAGQASGATIGGILLSAQHGVWMGYVAVALLLLSWLLSIGAKRWYCV